MIAGNGHVWSMFQTREKLQIESQVLLQIIHCIFTLIGLRLLG